MITVLATAQPWVFTGGINSAYSFSGANGTNPTVILLRGAPAGASVTVTYQSGLVNGHDAGGSGGTSGGTFPSSYGSGSPNLGSLVAAFTDAAGNVKSVWNVGNGAVITVPSGATQLQFGVNYSTTPTYSQGQFRYMTGYWNIAVKGLGPGGAGWLIIDEPSVGFVDQSTRLHFGDGPRGMGGDAKISFSTMLKQRGTAKIAINIHAGDSYVPTIGTQIFLYDVTCVDQDPVFAGTIDSIYTSWFTSNGDQMVELTCVSLEQCFDVIRVPGQLFQNQQIGSIFTSIFGYAAGCPVTLGQISGGVTVAQFLIEDLPTISDIFDKLCTAGEAQFVWSVDPGSQQINFGPPALNPAPFTIAQTQVLFAEIAVRADRHDFRNRQLIKLEYDAFGRSDEVFTGYGQGSFALRCPVHDVTNAWITKNTANTATGTFSANPSAGDTVTVSYPTSGSIYNWAASSPYAVSQTVIDSAGHLQQVTSVGAPYYHGNSSYGISGASTPTWNDAGGTTNDGSVTWTDKGLAGFGGYVVATYTFVTSLNNTQFGQVLIGGSAAATCQNLVDAINANRGAAGVTFSLPTWENTLCNADAPSGASFVIRNKYVGQGSVAALTDTSTAFSWSAAQTSGGITTFGTNSISIGLQTAQFQGSTNNLPSLAYLPGSNIIYLSSPLNAGTYLAVEYHRIDGDVIQVENSALVSTRASIEVGTGKYQALTSDSGATPVQGLSQAQAALAAFCQVPQTLELITYYPGISINQQIGLSWAFPYGPNIQNPVSGGVSNVLGGALIVPAQDGISRTYLLNFEDQYGGGDLSYGNGTIQIIFDGNGNATMQYLGPTDPATTYADSFGIAAAVGATPTTIVSAGTGGTIIAGAGPIGSGVTSIPSSLIPAPGSEMLITCKNFTGTVYSGAATHNGDSLAHAYLTWYPTSTGANAWAVQEVQAELIPCNPYLGTPFGHFRYTVRLVNIAQLGSYLDFWEQMGGGGGSISSTPSYAGGVMTNAPSSAASPITVQKDTTAVGTESGVNFKTGSNLVLTVADDPSNSTVDVTIALRCSDAETPGGTMNGTNQTFTLANAPSPAASLILVLNGVTQLQGTDYTLGTAGAWIAAHAYTLGNAIVDTNGHLQVCTVAGTSYSTAPTWNSTGGVTSDGSTVKWQDEGVATGSAIVQLSNSTPNSSNNEWMRCWYRY